MKGAKGWNIPRAKPPRLQAWIEIMNSGQLML